MCNFYGIGEMELEQIQHKLSDFNEILVTLGMLPLALVNPKDILPQEKNAHYFVPEKFKLLVNNVKKYGRLASVPLVYKDGEKYRVIDGAHRVESSKEAGLPYILVFVDSPDSKDEIISKQLSYNALVGKDDPVILAELFNSIEDITLKIESGLSSELVDISYNSLNFHVGEHKELLLMFMPDDVKVFDDGMDKIMDFTVAKPSTEVRVTSLEYYDKFLDAMRKVKKVENIKSNSIAVLRLVELANERIEQIKAESNDVEFEIPLADGSVDVVMKNGEIYKREAK